MLDFPNPTAQLLGKQTIDLENLYRQAARPEFRAIIRRIFTAHAHKTQLALEQISFSCLQADPEISQLEEREGMNNLIPRLQLCFVLEAYDLLCEQNGISRAKVRDHSAQITGPIVQRLYQEMYGKVQG